MTTPDFLIRLALAACTVIILAAEGERALAASSIGFLLVVRPIGGFRSSRVGLIQATFEGIGAVALFAIDTGATALLFFPIPLIVATAFRGWRSLSADESWTTFEATARRAYGSAVGLAPAFAATVMGLMDDADVSLTRASLPLTASAVMLVLVSSRALSARTLVADEVRQLAEAGPAVDAWPVAHGPADELTRELDAIAEQLRHAGAARSAVLDLRQLAQRSRVAVHAVAARWRSGIADGVSIEARQRFEAMRRWGQKEHAPRWLGPLGPGWTRVGSMLDLVRLLHTRQIEWLALFGTLWFRAAIVVVAPAAGRLSPAGIVPTALAEPRANDYVWAVAAGWACVTAALAPFIVARAEDPSRKGFRQAMALCEQTIALTLILALPSWISALFAVGVFNWVQRPDWRVWKLAAFAAVNYVALTLALFAATEADVWAVIAEVGIAMAATFLIGCSYGFLFPLTISWLIITPARLIVRRRRGAREITQRTVREVGRAAAEAQGLLDQLDQPEHLAQVAQAGAARLADLAVVLTRETEDRKPWKRRRHLDEALEEAVFGIVDPAGPEAHEGLHAHEPTFRPTELRNAILRPRSQRALRIVVRLVAWESLKWGTGPFRTRVRLVGDEIEVIITNPVGNADGQGYGTGGELIHNAALKLPGGHVLERGEIDGGRYGARPGSRIWLVRLRFSTTAIQRTRGNLEDPGANN